MPPRQASGCGAAGSSHGWIPPQRCRAHPPGTGSQCGGGVQEAFDEAFATAECCGGFTNSGFVHLDDAFTVTGSLNAAATATECGLHRDGQTVLICESNNLIGRLDRVLSTRAPGAPTFCAMWRAATLSPSWVMDSGRGANPGQTSVNALLRELCVLRETVAGVYSVSTGAASISMSLSITR